MYAASKQLAALIALTALGILLLSLGGVAAAASNWTMMSVDGIFAAAAFGGVCWVRAQPCSGS